jgi:hypothetical protein
MSDSCCWGFLFYLVSIFFISKCLGHIKFNIKLFKGCGRSQVSHVTFRIKISIHQHLLIFLSMAMQQIFAVNRMVLTEREREREREVSCFTTVLSM